MTDTKHTPTPWKHGFKRADESVVISSGGLGLTVAVVHQGAINNAQANAANIVKCVNMHDELVDALIDITRKTKDLNANVIAIEALKKAGAL